MCSQVSVLLPVEIESVAVGEKLCQDLSPIDQLWCLDIQLLDMLFAILL
jgi:hypothetical protein